MTLKAVSIAALALPVGGTAMAQAGLTVLPESRVILNGRSNVNSWSCATSTFQTSYGLDSTDQADAAVVRAKSVTRLTVTVPVRSLDCGRARMNADMFKALKADAFPEIRYVLRSYEVEPPQADTDSFTVNSVGELTVAGVTRRVDIQVKGARDGGEVRGTGAARILMTDFGIKPPTAFLGAIRTRNAIDVRVEIRVTQTVIAAAPR